MNTPNPATPAQAATPGSDAQNSNPTPVATPAPANNQGNQGNNQEGTVTITAKEYRDLQRAKARTLSFDKRMNIISTKNQTAKVGDEGGDPELVERLAASEEARQAAERKALQAEVSSRVRDILDKEEFKNIPKSTRDLILKNPAMLSKADNLEEAMLDIEDFLRENVIGADSGTVAMPQTPAAGPKNETPPVINSGAPAPTAAAGMEDISKLSGPERTRAMIRNKIREAKGVKQV